MDFSGLQDFFKNLGGSNWLDTYSRKTGISKENLLPQQLSPEQLYGQNFNFLQNQVKPMVAGGLDPVLADLLGIQTSNINKQAGEARRFTNQNLASSGFRGSGTNLMSNIFREQADATQEASANIGAMGLQNRQFYNNLLNSMNQYQGGQNLGYEQYRQGAYSGLGQTLSDRDLALKELALKKEELDQNSGFDFGGFLGNLLTGGATIGAAAITKSDKKLKKNIKDTGLKTESGLPIKTFTYKDDKKERTYVGHLAQEVEKKFPDAVYKVIDYNRIPDGIFQEVK